MTKRHPMISIALVTLWLLGIHAQSLAAHHVCIANRNTDTVAVLNVSDGQVTSTSLALDDGEVIAGKGFFGVAIAPDGRIYTANPSQNTVYVTEVFDGQLLHTQTILDVGKKPLGVAVSPRGRFVYVTNAAGDNLTVIDTDYDPPFVTTPRINVGDQPAGVAVSPDGDMVFVVNGRGEREEGDQDVSTGSLWAISTFTGNTLWKVSPLGENPVGVAVSPDGQRLYVTISGDAKLAVINALTAQEETGHYTRIPVGKTPVGVAVSPDGSLIFVANRGNDTLSVIRTADSIDDFKRMEPVDVLGSHPVGVSVTPDGATVYVTCRGYIPDGQQELSGNGVAVIQVSDFSVTFIDGEGLASPASFGQFIGSVSPPAAPGDFSATAISDSAVLLSWMDNAMDESGYQVYRKQGTCGTDPFADAQEPLATASANAIDFEDTSEVEESQTYCYQVLAYNTLGLSDPSPAVQVTTYPAVPSDLMAMAASSNHIDVYWTDNSSGESGFVIQRQPGPTSQGFETVAVVSQDVTTYSDTDHVHDATTYTYRVYAYDDIHFQGVIAMDETRLAYSEENTATTPLAAPTGLSVVDSSVKYIDLAWKDNSSSESGYRIERKVISEEPVQTAADETTPSEASSFTEIASVGPNVRTYTDEDVEPNTDYVYRVQAYSGEQASDYSNEAQADTSAACFIATLGDGDGIAHGCRAACAALFLLAATILPAARSGQHRLPQPSIAEKHCQGLRLRRTP